MKARKRLLTIFLVTLILTVASTFTPFTILSYGAENTFDYTLFQEFLDEYTTKNVQIGTFRLTTVDYNKINNDKAQLDNSLYHKVLDNLKEANPSKLSSHDEKVAFWINAYNIGAIKMIIDHYPVKSIRDRKINFLKNPWNIKILSVGGSEYSLGQIEHDILLKELAEPMAHFGVVCASLSCPNLNPEAYTPEKVMDQLAGMAKAFLADEQKGMMIDRSRNKVFFSKIFKFDRKTFPDGAESAIRIFTIHFAPDDLKYLMNNTYKIDYLDYDWSLNNNAR